VPVGHHLLPAEFGGLLSVSFRGRRHLLFCGRFDRFVRCLFVNRLEHLSRAAMMPNSNGNARSEKAFYTGFSAAS